MRILLEVCVDSPQGLAAAIKGGADRIELCSALDVGGLTPSPGLMVLAAQAPIPVYAMIRPRAGSFVFDGDDEKTVMADIHAVRAAGLAGVVIGANRPDMTLDLPLLQRLMERAEGLGVTLHRAFDLTPDPNAALEQAVDLGVERILTSGLAVNSSEGLDILKRLVRQASGRVSIMPGGGVNLATVERVVTETGASEIHSSCRRLVENEDERASAFGFQPPRSYATDAGIVKEMRVFLDRLSK
ncbi:copper homeostasis protein CutC [Rhizobium sp. LCM 4573]|uniref:copper homeostasis protein CutC n=1 Tax=Rhizobium sp. LCM 4573 TaxID=1848291 RepID=UPI0008DA6732|nr:copper homeostasis protein CutC [Rhizobium sp. LCM 4573]OHV77494.1 copper homeostasis protein CutC [Rhizobium sp. LCM 4573]